MNGGQEQKGGAKGAAGWGQVTGVGDNPGLDASLGSDSKSDRSLLVQVKSVGEAGSPRHHFAANIPVPLGSYSFREVTRGMWKS